MSQKNVLILNALESNVPISESTSRGIRRVLDAEGVGVRNQFFEYLDLVRNPEPEHRSLMAEYVRQRYGHRRIDLVITLYPEALLFALNEGCAIFPGVPMVALYLPEGFELPQESCPVIQQIVLPDIRGTLEIALKLVADAELVYVVSGVHPLDKWLENRVRQDLKPWEPLLEIRYLSGLPLMEIIATLSDAPPHSIVLVTSFQQDATGALFTSVGVVEKLGRDSRAPVFGLLDSLIGHGIVGGSVASFEYIGTKAAEMGLDMVRGVQSPENVPTFLNVSHLPMFDWRQIRHWGLSEDDLPPGSILVNRESTFLDFKYHILVGLVFIAGQSFLIFFLLAQRRRRRTAEENLRWKTEELDKFFSMSLDLLCIAGTDGYFLRLNPAWEKTLGYRIAELLSKRFLEFVHPDDVAATSAVIQALAEQKQVVDFSNRYRCRDGSYRQLLWSAAAVGSMIYAAARDLTERMRAEEIIRESAKELQSLTGRLILGQEEERRRLARELHDDLSQRLAVLAIEAGKMEAAAKDGQDSILTPLRDLRDQAIRIAADVHDLSRRLHPSILDDLGLAKAVEAECAQFTAREGVAVAFTAQSIPERLPQDVSLALYRIVQEGLNNIAKHACARRVTVSLGRSEAGLRLSIEDDGIGFDAAEVGKRPGLGLSSIRERVRLVHGKHRITSEPEKGTTIEVTAPILKAPATPAASPERLS